MTIAEMDLLLFQTTYVINEVTKKVMQFFETTDFVIPDLIRNPVFTWIPAFAGMTPRSRNAGMDKPLNALLNNLQ
jgi:hypothetical protein